MPKAPVGELSQFLVNELGRLPPDRQLRIDGNRAWIICPYHAGGMERSASFTIFLGDGTDGPPPGWCGCFGCKQNHHWNEFAELFGLALLTKGKVREASASVFLGMDFIEPIPPDYTKFSTWPENTDWRDQPAKTLRKFQARSIRLGRESRLYFPVLVYGENMGGIQCLLRNPQGDRDKSYINTSGEWSKRALFGYDLARKRKGPLWAVEGPRDTTNVYSAKSRVVGLIGSAVTDQKINLILDLDPPSVLIATDPDKAGDVAAEHLAEGLRNRIPFMRMPMKRDDEHPENNEDPAKLSKGKIQRATQRMIELYGE